MDARLPAHVEVGGLIRAVQAAGGFAMVTQKGERDAGTIMVICCEKGTNGRSWERMPHPDGDRRWTLTRKQDPENPREFEEWCIRRQSQDPDMWVVELDIVNAERFILQDAAGG